MHHHHHYPVDKLIVALDVEESQVKKYVRDLKDHVWGFKVGLRLFIQAGPRIIRFLKSEGCRVFLDLKFFDIPNTVFSAVKELQQELHVFNVDMFNMHILGSSAMMKQVSEYIKGLRVTRRPLMLGVTILTSVDPNTLASELLIPIGLKSYVIHLAKLAKQSDLDGVVASPLEIKGLREELGPDFKIITPGIRKPGGPVDDQKRTMTPYEAIREGASGIVVGRPIIDAPDPLNATIAILEDMERALYEKAKSEGDENF